MYWEPGVQYNYGDVVTFEGLQYQIIQPHRSQGDWTPPVTPALWGLFKGSGGDCYNQGSNYQGNDCKIQPCCGQPESCQKVSQGYDCKVQPCCGQPESCQKIEQVSYQQVESVQVSAQPQKEKHWYDVDDKHKKELELGGGLLAGVAALGAGYYAYKQHEKKSEEKQAHAWSASTWAAESQARTQQWRSGRYSAPVAWIWTEGRSIPRDAIQGGEERGESLYICRAYHDGGLFVGKASTVFKRGGVIGYKKEEIHVDKYEVLVGNSSAVKWVPCSGRLNIQALRARPVEGGREPDGTPIYIAQAPHHGAVHPGKACEVYGDGCFIPYDNSEKKVKEYAVLCYAG